MTSKQHTTAFLNWMLSHGVDRFDLAASREPNNGAWLPGAQNASRTIVDASRAWCWLENLTGAERQHQRLTKHAARWTPDDSGAEICIRPARLNTAGEPCSWFVVLLDDLPPTLALGIARKYAALVVETSTANCQVWLHCTQPLAEAERGRVQSWLSLKTGADRGSITGEHHGRLPGYRNRKPNRNAEWCNILAATDGAAFDPSQALAETPADPDFALIHSPTPVAARLTTKSGEVVSCRPAASDESRREFGWAVVAFQRGVPRDQILADLTNRAAGRRGRRDAERYAVRTADRAERAAA